MTKRRQIMGMRKWTVILPCLVIFMLFLKTDLKAQGHWEFGFHYSQWSIDEIKNNNNNLDKISYNHDISFDSGGDNFGFEVRWYPAGQYGSFSVGLSVEKTTMRVSLPSLSASMDLKDSVTQKTASFQGQASGQFLIKPLSFHLSLRWDIKPSWRVHPYIAFGAGIATGAALEEAEFSASWSGDLNVEGEASQHYEESISKTFKELEQEFEDEGDEFFIPEFLPFVQLCIGTRAVISENFHILVETGIWNGFIIRGGISLRI
jgi:hypothetical protein